MRGALTAPRITRISSNRPTAIIPYAKTARLDRGRVPFRRRGFRRRPKLRCCLAASLKFKVITAAVRVDPDDGVVVDVHERHVLVVDREAGVQIQKIA